MISKLEDLRDAPMDLLLLADPSEQLVKDYLARGTCHVLVDQSTTIGAFVLLPTRPKMIELVNIAVHPDYQGKGFGKYLIQYAVQLAKEQHYKTIELGTANSSINQIALYQKCGFTFTHIEKGFFLKHYSDVIYENGIQAVDMIRLSQDL